MTVTASNPGAEILSVPGQHKGWTGGPDTRPGTTRLGHRRAFLADCSFDDVKEVTARG